MNSESVCAHLQQTVKEMNNCRLFGYLFEITTRLEIYKWMYEESSACFKQGMPTGSHSYS